MDRSAHSQARSQSRTPYTPMPKAMDFTAIFGKETKDSDNRLLPSYSSPCITFRFCYSFQHTQPYLGICVTFEELY